MELGSRSRKKKARCAGTLERKGGAQSFHKSEVQVWQTSNRRIPTQTLHQSTLNPNFGFVATLVMATMFQISEISKSDDFSERRSIHNIFIIVQVNLCDLLITRIIDMISILSIGFYFVVLHQYC